MMPVNCNTIEVWADIKGYEGQYYVSSKGRVKKIVTDKDRNVKEKLLAQQCIGGSREYRAAGLTKDGVQKLYYIHRLVAEAFVGLPVCNPDGTKFRTSPEINHIDGNCSNNVPSNLEWCDRYYNNSHRRPSSEWNYTHNTYETGRKKHDTKKKQQ